MLARLSYQGIPIWRHTQVLQWASQLVSGLVAVVLVYWFFINIANAIQERDIPFGFSFLSRAYQTPIGQHFLLYEATSETFLYAFGVATTNTLIVSISGVILATALGVVIGVGRLSTNWIVARIAVIYIGFFRNVPLLIQLYFWFYLVLTLPTVQEGYVVAGKVFINNAGVSTPWPIATALGTALGWLALAAASILAGVVTYRWLDRREMQTSAASHSVLFGFGVAIMLGAAAWVVVSTVGGQAPFIISHPAPQGTFGRIDGGITFSAGLIALLAGLVIYTSSFIAEIVRAGIQSVGRGQTEASRSLGLSPLSTLRQVTFPQALRVIMPPLISQWLNLTKNSSLAGAIGFSDLTNVAKTMTQTAPAVSIFILIMLTYLAMSLTWSLLGNLYNRHVRFTGS